MPRPSFTFGPRVSAAAAALAFAASGTSAVRASPVAFVGPVRGDVRDRADGGPIAGAAIALELPSGAKVSSTTSDGEGAFALAIPHAGSYRIVTRARGYRDASVPLTTEGNDGKGLDIRLVRDRELREIGVTVVHPGDKASAPSDRSIGQVELASAGSLRAGDSLGKLSGIDLTGDAAAPGGDEYVSLRGLRPGESQTFLDGHPIGPIGVMGTSPDTDGTIEGFNYQDAPYFALRDIDVIFGAGAGGLMSGDAVAGTVNLRTFDPTASAQATLQQGLGTQGRAFTALRATGTDGKFGYVIVHGVSGTYGEFPGGQIAQTGLRGTDFTSQTLGESTYHVSGDYVLRNELAKFVYSATSNTKVAFSAYDATSWADKTGEGDNDFNPYAYTLANAPVGASPACPHGVLVTANSGSDCLSPAAYAAGASGPAGGGPGAWQALRNQDYDGRLTSIAGPRTFALDVFSDQYSVLYHRDASAASGPLDTFLNDWSTQGVSLSDEFAGRENSFGLGAAWLRQSLGGNATSPNGSGLIEAAPALRIERSVYANDVFMPTQQLSFLFNAWLKSASGDATTRFDPRVSVIYKPEPSDAFRLTGGEASDEPGLQSDRVNLLPVGALNPNCGAIERADASAPAPIDVGSGPSAHLSAESGSDLEAGYDHRFAGNSTVGVTVYDANIANRLVTGEFAAGTQLPAAAVPALFARIGQFCGLAPSPQAITFTLNRAFNAATARLRGLEVAGRARASAHVAVDYAYDVQSIVLNDLPDMVLKTDPTLVNGIQVFGVPLHKATLGLEVETRGGLSVDLDGHAVGPNNPQQLPGYAYADVSLAQTLPKQTSIAVSIANLFNSHAQTYGLVGYGLPYATNSFSGASSNPFLQQFNERYGLAPRALSVSATLHYR